MNTVRAGLAFGVILSTAAMMGCNTHKDLDVALIPSGTSPIADVPIPAGFKMINDESTSKVVLSTSQRFVDHMYKGSDDYLPVVRFYREQLPTKGWTIVEQVQMHDEVTLHFTKGSEDCVVTVTPGKMGGLFKTHVRIQIDATAHLTTK